MNVKVTLGSDASLSSQVLADLKKRITEGQKGLNASWAEKLFRGKIASYVVTGAAASVSVSGDVKFQCKGNTLGVSAGLAELGKCVREKGGKISAMGTFSASIAATPYALQFVATLRKDDVNEGLARAPTGVTSSVVGRTPARGRSRSSIRTG